MSACHRRCVDKTRRRGSHPARSRHRPARIKVAGFLRDTSLRTWNFDAPPSTPDGPSIRLVFSGGEPRSKSVRRRFCSGTGVGTVIFKVNKPARHNDTHGIRGGPLACKRCCDVGSVERVECRRPVGGDGLLRKAQGDAAFADQLMESGFDTVFRVGGGAGLPRICTCRKHTRSSDDQRAAVATTVTPRGSLARRKRSAPRWASSDGRCTRSATTLPSLELEKHWAKTTLMQHGQRVLRHVELRDLDWRAKQIMIVQHKMGRPLRLPLLADVDWAIIDYIRGGRPETACPKVFVKHRHPFDTFGCASSVASRLSRQCAPSDTSHQIIGTCVSFRTVAAQNDTNRKAPT